MEHKSGEIVVHRDDIRGSILEKAPEKEAGIHTGGGQEPWHCLLWWFPKDDALPSGPSCRRLLS